MNGKIVLNNIILGHRSPAFCVGRKQPPTKSPKQALQNLKLNLRIWLKYLSAFPYLIPKYGQRLKVIFGENSSSGNTPSNPPWILPEWRTSTGVICPRCQTEIQALLKSHRVGRNKRIGAPFIFCSCVRLEPSRFPSPRFGTRTAFFTDHWSTVLEALEFFEHVSVQLASTDKQYLGAGVYAEYLRCNDARRYPPQH